MSADARTINFQDLLTATATDCGLDPDNLGAAEGKALATQLATAVKREWREDEKRVSRLVFIGRNLDRAELEAAFAACAA